MDHRSRRRRQSQELEAMRSRKEQVLADLLRLRDHLDVDRHVRWQFREVYEQVNSLCADALTSCRELNQALDRIRAVVEEAEADADPT